MFVSQQAKRCIFYDASFRLRWRIFVFREEYKMKKLILSALSLTFILSAAFFASGCGKKDNHTHSFTQEIAEDKYLASEATCTEKARYYYSCKCGEKGTETFGYGSPLGHKFTNYVSDGNAKCTEDGTKTAKCDRCSETDTVTDVGSKLGHEFTNYISDNNATYEKDGTKTAHCNRKGCTATNTIADEGTKLESKMAFKTLTVGQKNIDGNVPVYGKVPNVQKTYSFIDEVKTEGNVQYVVSLDIYGIKQVATKTIPLNEGDNVVYITEQIDGNPKTIYEVTIRRRKIYTVSFNLQGGSAVESQQIEEDSLANEPSTTKTGYSFIEWDYDFSKPVTDNITITASWNVIVYGITYELNGGTNDESNPANYTVETPTIDFVVPSKTGYSFNGWYTQKDFSGDNITKLPQGSYGNVTLYADWRIVTYNITYVLNGGETIGENPTEYTIESQDITLADPTGKHTFIGWYKDEALQEKITVITNRSFGDITLYADWQHQITADWVIDKTPTCTNTGLRHKVCSICNANYNYETLATVPTAHVSGEEVKENVVNPTCTENGSYDGVIRCTECNVILSSTHVNTEMADHEWNESKRCKHCNCDYFSQDLEYTLSSSGTSYIVSGIGSCVDSDIIIPANYKGKQVISIGDSAFYGCSSLTSISIPDSVTSIGDFAFVVCGRLMNITIPDSVTSIGNFAFDSCGGLMNIIIPDGVTYIGDNAFHGCGSLTSITIPDSVTSIGNRVFDGCDGLTSITISNNVTSISDYAFRNCSSLKSVIIPDSVASIGDWAFDDCSSLKTVLYKGTAEQWNKISISAGNRDLTNADRYYYSESEPALSSDGTAYNGNYWHYDTDGVTPVIWKKEN